MRKTYLNYRPIMFMALAVMAATLTVSGLKLNNYFMFVSGIVAILLIIGCVLVLFPHRRYFVLTILVLFIGIGVLTTVHIDRWEGKTSSGEIRMVLTDDMIVEDGMVIGVVKNITVNGRKTKGRAELSLRLDSQTMLGNISAGDTVIVFGGVLSPISLVNNGRINTSSYKSDIRYTITTQESEVRRVRGRAGIFESARMGIKDIIYRYSPDEDAASICYAMITGVGDNLSPEVKSGYSISGLAHVLSASGLHIGFVFTLVGWVLNTVKSGRRGKFWTLAIAAILYSAICNYSVSIVRAAIMGVISAACVMLGRKNDTLNSLMVSVLLIIGIRPLFLFDLSFLLSFSSVLGIVLLYRIFVKLFARVKFLSGNIGSGLAVACAANIGIFPVLSYYFKVFYVYGLAANLIALPIINVAFVVVLALVIVSVVLPPLGVLTVVPLYVIKWVNDFAIWVSQLPNAEILVFVIGLTAIPFYLGVFLMAGIANMKVRTKKVSALILSSIIAFSFVPYNVAKVSYARALTAVASNGAAVSVIYNESGECAIVGAVDKSNRHDLIDTMINRRQRKVNSLVVTNPSVARIEFADKLVRLLGIKDLVVVTEDYGLSDEYAETLKGKGVKVRQAYTDIAYKVIGMELVVYNYEGVRLGIKLTTQSGLEVLYPSSSSENINRTLAILGGQADIVISRNYINALDAGIYLVTAGSDGKSGVLSARERGNFTINI